MCVANMGQGSSSIADEDSASESEGFLTQSSQARKKQKPSRSCKRCLKLQTCCAILGLTIVAACAVVGVLYLSGGPEIKLEGRTPRTDQKSDAADCITIPWPAGPVLFWTAYVFVIFLLLYFFWNYLRAITECFWCKS